MTTETEERQTNCMSVGGDRSVQAAPALSRTPTNLILAGTTATILLTGKDAEGYGYSGFFGSFPGLAKYWETGFRREPPDWQGRGMIQCRKLDNQLINKNKR
jgi:hypothetical protein